MHKKNEDHKTTEAKLALSTEERIRRAAARVFTQKGYEATKTRDIAEAANISIASLHYYFRSKEKLFQLVIQESLAEFSKKIDETLNSELPLHEKIQRFVVVYIDFLKEKPFLPMFILSEAQRNAERLHHMMNDTAAMPRLQQQIDQLVVEGVIRPISMEHFFSNLIGLVVFPFISKPLMKIKTGIDEAGYQRMLEERKTIVPEMIIHYLYLQPPGK